ncbi:helix-turn-helix transcriptional regulator [Rhizobium miluonense]|uniref:Predicted transcriptional regulator YheO, contains PAS and DNA-binding HTH domains n=1 Tax=Rhizobium miluonense TaxID=411945 RepID=A0A1C3VFI1_9HYPH|nr:PAS domain-containing protein [Rhizobium miluonense]SCB26501.1 Predicted transcriptional regulator YheO, contains PAS and DNA-binding HTH domains [Rhizobium miluonense]
MSRKIDPNSETAPDQDDVLQFAPVAEAVAILLKPHAEVVIHDLKTQTIAYIANNISRRDVGGSSLADLKDIGSLGADVVRPYRKTNFDGRQLKSITAVLRNGTGEPYGLLCINFDIAPIEAARDALNLLAAFQGAGAQPSALFHADWQETVNAAIADFLGERGLAASALAKEDHATLVERLEQEGYFSIRNLVPYLARLLGISRATVYKHLREARQKKLLTAED